MLLWLVLEHRRTNAALSAWVHHGGPNVISFIVVSGVSRDDCAFIEALNVGK